jgi:hypothetical protein
MLQPCWMSTAFATSSSAGAAFAPAMPSTTALMGGPLTNPWPYSLTPSAGIVGAMGSGDGFCALTTCSWEQSDTMVKVYVPLRGVQTDMLRPTFTPTSVEARSPGFTPNFCCGVRHHNCPHARAVISSTSALTWSGTVPNADNCRKKSLSQDCCEVSV